MGVIESNMDREKENRMDDRVERVQLVSPSLSMFFTNEQFVSITRNALAQGKQTLEASIAKNELRLAKHQRALVKLESKKTRLTSRLQRYLKTKITCAPDVSIDLRECLKKIRNEEAKVEKYENQLETLNRRLDEHTSRSMSIESDFSDASSSMSTSPGQ